MAGVGKPKTSRKAIEADQRHAAAVNLRKAGMSFEEISRQLGFASASGAYAAVRSAMDKTLREPADALRQMELSRLDAMQERVWDGVLGGDKDSINACLKIMAQRARLLGLERREAPLSVKLPRLEKASDALPVTAALLDKAAAGELLPDEAAKLAGLTANFMKAAETADLEERIRQLEAAHSRRDPEMGGGKHEPFGT